MKLHLGTLHCYRQTKLRIEGQPVAAAVEHVPAPVSQQRAWLSSWSWSWLSWSSWSSWWSWWGQVLGHKLDESAELGVGEGLGVGAGLGQGVGPGVGVGVGLALVGPLVGRLLQMLRNWNRKRSHPPSSTGSKFRRHKSPCMALSRARPRRVSLLHIGWWCGP